MEKNRKHRDPSIDVAKGLLVILLIILHIAGVGGWSMKIDNQLFDIVNSWQHPLICCYFMQTFFMITGACYRIVSVIHFQYNNIKILNRKILEL